MRRRAMPVLAAALGVGAAVVPASPAAAADHQVVKEGSTTFETPSGTLTCPHRVSLRWTDFDETSGHQELSAHARGNEGDWTAACGSTVTVTLHYTVDVGRRFEYHSDRVHADVFADAYPAAGPGVQGYEWISADYVIYYFGCDCEVEYHLEPGSK